MVRVFTGALLAATGSAVGVVRLTVLVNCPVAVGVTTIVIVSVAPDAMEGMVPVTTWPFWVIVACAEVAETIVKPAGTVSVMTTFDAALGPALATVIV